MKKSTRTTVMIIALLCIAGFAFWRISLNPYEEKYFSQEMQLKYPTVEAVLGAMGEGWKHDNDRQEELLNEAYGFNLIKRYGPLEPQAATMRAVREIRYYKSNKLAVVNLEPTNSGSTGPAWWFIWRKGRWVFYPETPWLWLLELVHKI